MRALIAAVAAALLLPAAALAHVTVAPPFVDDGVETEIAFETPNERAPHATVEVRTTAPPGVKVVSASAPPGWTAAVSGATVIWRGGRIEGTRVVAFPVRVLPRVRAGTYSFTSAQRYDDGATVKWKVDFSVLPAQGKAAPGQHPWGAVLAGLAGAVVIAGSLIGVRLLRRRSLQER